MDLSHLCVLVPEIFYWMLFVSQPSTCESLAQGKKQGIGIFGGLSVCPLWVPEREPRQ